MAKKSTTYKGRAKPYGKSGHYHEPMRHSLQARGIRTGNLARPIRLPDTDKDGVPDRFDCKPLDPTKQDFEQTIVEDFKEELDVDVDEADIKEIDGEYYLVEADGGEWMVFEDFDDAESYAIDRVREDLEENPEYFEKNWLKSHVFVSDTDKRVIANDEADAVVGDMSDSDLLERAELDDEWDELDEEYDEIEDEVDRRTGETEDDAQIEGWLDEQEARMDEIFGKKEKLIDQARDEVYDEIYNEWYDGLDRDPIGFLVDEQGMYIEEDVMDASFIQIDVDEASRDAVDTDGVAHFLSTYDGNQVDLPSGAVAFRTN